MKVEKITKALSLNLPSHVVRSRDPRAILAALFTAWIPLSTAVLVSVIEHLPSPAIAQSTRTNGLLEASPGSACIDPNIKQAMQDLRKARSEPVVAFVSKMVAIPRKDLPKNKTKNGATLTADEARELGRKKRAEIARAQATVNGEHPDVAELRETLSGAALAGKSDGLDDVSNGVSEEEAEELIGFARLFSGTLEVGDEVYVLGPKFSPAHPRTAPEPQQVTITALYLLMGRELEPLTSVPPGVVFGIGGLEGHIMKSGTLCSQIEGGPNLAGVVMGGQPIVRVALEPTNPADLAQMVKGMRLLEQSDPCAAYEVLENGEHVILTAGELHLERCLKDLRERFAKCEIQAGAPIVPYRESIVSANEMNAPKSKDAPRGTVVSSNPSKSVNIQLRVRPLPDSASNYLLRNASLVKELHEEQNLNEQGGDADNDAEDLTQSRTSDAPRTGDARGLDALKAVREGLAEALQEVKSGRDTWKEAFQRSVAFGPRRSGPNVLIDATPDQVFGS